MQSSFCLQNQGQPDWLTKDITSLPRTGVPASLLWLDTEYAKDWLFSLFVFIPNLFVVTLFSFYHCSVEYSVLEIFKCIISGL